MKILFVIWLTFVVWSQVHAKKDGECKSHTGEVWHDCGSACTPTCDEPVMRCTRQCVPRCECPSDKPLKDGNVCVAEDMCPCALYNTYIGARQTSTDIDGNEYINSSGYTKYFCNGVCNNNKKACFATGSNDVGVQFEKIDDPSTIVMRQMIMDTACKCE